MSAFRAPGVTLYGDSIMAGGIADRLRRLMPDTLIADRSVPGDTAANAWCRFPYEVRATKLVVLQHGTNDLSAGHSPLTPLLKMAEYAIAEGRKVVFTGITRRPDRIVSPIDTEIMAMARALGAGYANWYLVPLDSDDDLHPSAAMADTLAMQLAKTLETM